ncbi:hypothetical protein CR513_58485, partial [Mucuna pruriens]
MPSQFTPLKEKKARIMREICHARLLNFPQAIKSRVMGRNQQEWCDFHRASGHSTEDCWTLGVQLESLVQQGRLGKYVARVGNERTKSREPSTKRTERIRGREDRSRSPRPAPTFYRGTISTISGGETSHGD